ncbi:MAG TPA: alpha-L-fucosidase [Lachnoclostridium phytofermentans]|uniref:alpha-L-fucosidase n=1 Tax=Lachnoclostridium phytofermentans TaxID=66219 RepID=A0A3D2X5C5_9FIRM|nr:alpha-L-fucosidase [Lachnoclostridium sp.]HCL02166.1 alpha-L-fucosidase [Lachnoclostridium phytofermentans]
MNREKTDWFCDARFGMFIHWGLYAIPGQGEWYRSFDRVNAKDYEKYFNEFDPQEFNPRQWAQLAKEAGMKYIVLTAKHHDGFCLFDSQYTDYKSTNTKAGKDLIKEYVEAVREAGLKVGIYYSLVDWHHPDYPKYNDMFHPMRENDSYKEDKYDWDNYLNYMHGQIEELCSNYGKLDLLWFDFSYGEMKGEKWKATELMEMVRRLQPEVLVNDRLEGGGSSHGSIMEGKPSAISGDFASPEQCMPTSELHNKIGERVVWELCTTINDSWGYVSSDKNYKSAVFLIHKLVECVSKSGNLILNVGPDAHGRIPKEQAEVLKQIGEWMKMNGESIYGCEGSKLPRPEWGRYTQKENILYAHIMEAPIGPIPITGVAKEQIESIRVLWDGSVAKDASTALGPRKNPDTQFITLGVNGNFTYPLPVEADTVLKVVLK